MAKLSSWNIFVQKVYKENPGKTFGEALKIASTLKKQGKMNTGKMNTGKMNTGKMNTNVNMNSKGKKGKTKKSKTTKKGKKH
jgi:hypothetical protein